MKCPHCGSEWNIAASVTVTVQKCPFCGKDLAPKAAENATLESVLRNIRETYGPEQMKDGRNLVALFLDLAPKMRKEQKMLKNFAKVGGPETLFAAASKSEGERQTAQNKVMFRLTEELLMAESHAKTVCAAYFAALCGETAAPAVESDADVIEPPLPADDFGGETQIFHSSDFEITADGELTAYRGEDIHIRIPAGVKRIGEGVFKDNRNIRSVELPEGLRSIGPNAFASAWHMKTVTFPASLESVEKKAFFCSGLTAAVLPAGLTQIGEAAFGGCEKLREVVLPAKLTVAGKMAFSKCAAETVTIPGSLKTVPEGMFLLCEHLRQVTLQPGVQKVDNLAFSTCSALERVYVPASVAEMHTSAFMRVEKKRVQVVLSEPDKDPGKKRFSNVQRITFR